MGLNNPHGLRALRAAFPDVPLVVDAGIGLPSHAAAAMELGFDAVLLNSADFFASDVIDENELPPLPDTPPAL